MRPRIQMSLVVLLLSTGAASADRDAGREVFRQNCVACHAIECNRSGPKLGGVIGRTAATVPDFTGYSEAMKKSEIVWNEDSLAAFLTDPTAVVPKNAMSSFGGLRDEKKRQDLIAFLGQPDTSLDLCF